MKGWALRYGVAVTIGALLTGAGTARAQNEKPEPPPIFVDEDDSGDTGSGGGTGTGPQTEQPGGGGAGCVPACREGFLCHRGRCVSACNPPCGPQEVCTVQRQCVSRQAAAPPAQPPAAQPPPQQPGAGSGAGGPRYGEPTQPDDPGWGRGAGIWGLLNIPILLGGATGVFFADSDTAVGGIGGALTLYSGVATIVVGAGAASPSGPQVKSMTGTLVPGWILYAFSMASAVGLLAAAASDLLDVAPGLVYVPAGFASGANLFFAITGFVESARARAAQAPSGPTSSSASGRVHLAPMVVSTPGEGATGTGLTLGGRL